MTTTEHLHLALAALAPATLSFHHDQAPDTATAPWLVGSLQVGDSTATLGGARASTGTMWVVTVAALTGGQARVHAHQATLAWSGARIAVPGWTTGSVLPPRSRGPYNAGLRATDTDLPYQVIRLEFDLTVSRIP